MKMRDYLLDTNAISALLNRHEKVVTNVNEATDEGGEIFLSVISDYEINRGLFAANAMERNMEYCERDTLD
jgi:tRNA(fMet)-specific endonuclease VapC